MWEIIFMVLILKIPMVYVGWVIWWAIKAEPVVGSEDEPAPAVNWKPWRGTDGPPSRRGGPHGGRLRRTARAGRRRDRVEA